MNMKNIMSIDLEDYFCDLPFSQWSNYKSRVVETTNVILKLLERYKVQATFFSLGFIAETHPELIESIQAKGHELGTHGYSHTDIRKMTSDSFELDLKKSIQIIEKISGDKVLGFRAPFFSISKKNLWAFAVLKKFLKYDSSIFPVRSPLYGIPDAITHPYFVSNNDPLKIDENSDFLEIPPLTLKLPLVGNLPTAGGFYLRFLPYQFLKWGISKMNKKGFPAMCYIHPKDLDYNMPRISGYSWHYYWGLKNAEKKFEKLLKDFSFSSAREVLLN